jgi:hypothetical protein
VPVQSSSRILRRERRVRFRYFKLYFWGGMIPNPEKVVTRQKQMARKMVCAVLLREIRCASVMNEEGFLAKYVYRTNHVIETILENKRHSILVPRKLKQY